MTRCAVSASTAPPRRRARAAAAASATAWFGRRRRAQVLGFQITSAKFPSRQTSARRLPSLARVGASMAATACARSKTTLSADLRRVRDAALRRVAPSTICGVAITASASRGSERPRRIAPLSGAANYTACSGAGRVEGGDGDAHRAVRATSWHLRGRADAIDGCSDAFRRRSSEACRTATAEAWADDPPVVLMLSSVFENLDAKLQQVRAHREQIALVVAPGPHVADYDGGGRGPVRFWPYGACTDWRCTHSTTVLGYRHDVGFTGSMDRYNKRSSCAASRSTTRRCARR